MNDYVIDPMFFYWCSVFDALGTFSSVISIVFGLVLVIGIVMIVGFSVNQEYDSLPFAKKLTAIASFFFALFVALAIFIPSKDTMIQMAIARQVTYKNIDKAEEKIKGAVDYIFKKVEEVKK